MKILFLHGWKSSPVDKKQAYLASRGHQVIDPRLPDNDFGEAVWIAEASYKQHAPDVIVGVSRGGAVAMNFDSKETPLVLLCPAWKRWGAWKRGKASCLILHSPQDDIVAFSDSEELVGNSGLPLESLIRVGSDHHLADTESLSVLAWACDFLVSEDKGFWLTGVDRGTLNPLGASQLTSQEEGSYICDACGEEIVIPLDVAEGAHQTYVEDCPVCCRANIIHVEISDRGVVSVWSEPEQDYD